MDLDDDLGTANQQAVPSVDGQENARPQRYHKGDIGPDGRIFHTYRKGRPCWFPNAESMEKYNKQKNIISKKALCGPTRTLKGLSRVLLSSAKNRAKKSGGEVTITVEWIQERLQRGISEISGTPFVINYDPGAKSGRTQARSPSLDRIDSKNPNYSPENTRVLCWQENCALSIFGDRDSLPVLEALVAGLRLKVLGSPDASSSSSF